MEKKTGKVKEIQLKRTDQ